MYSPKQFLVDDRAVIETFVYRNPFATLTSVIDGDLVATHLPLLLMRDEEGSMLYGHVARSNPHWRAFDGKRNSLAIFLGPHAYISPRWYVKAPSVPTWNYCAVHVGGMPEVVAENRVPALLAEQTRRMEGEDGWSYADLPSSYREGMEKQIVWFKMAMNRVEGKFKLSQNKPIADQLGAIAGLQSSGSATAREVAELMRASLDAAGSE